MILPIQFERLIDVPRRSPGDPLKDLPCEEVERKEKEQGDAQAKTEKEKDETCETEDLKCKSLN